MDITQKDIELLELYYRKDKGEKDIERLIKWKETKASLVNLIENDYLYGEVVWGKQHKLEECSPQVIPNPDGYCVTKKALHDFNWELS